MFYTRLFREDGGGTGGGGGLVNLMEGMNNLEQVPPGGGEGGASETPEEKAAKELEAQQTEIKKEAFENDGVTLKPGYLKDDKGIIAKDPNYTAPVEGLDDKGELLPGYKKDEQGNVVKDPDYKEQQLSDEELDKQFWEEVNKITGDDIEIEYPEGVDPMSPQGIAHYTQAIREDARVAFEEYLRENFARPYAYMVHYKNGGSDEDFFTDKNGFQLPEQDKFDASADLQTAVYKHDLKSRGLDDEAIEALVQKAIKDNKLKEKADASYKTIGDAQRKQVEDITKMDAARKESTQKAVTGMITKIDQAISGKDLRFVIPEAEKKAFRDFAINSMRYDVGTGTFSIVHKVESDQINELLETLFFQHKKGDLKALVEKQSKTNAAHNLRLRMKPASGGPGSGAPAAKDDKNFIPLSEMTT